MWPRKKRDKVVAEITTTHVIKLMREEGKFLDQQQAIDFLNERGRAQRMWTEMMYAAESYIKSELAQSHPNAARLKSDSLASIRVIYSAGQTESPIELTSAEMGNSLHGAGSF